MSLDLKQIEKRFASYEARIAELEKRIAKLLIENAFLKQKKNSRNSSIPPSKDQNRNSKNRSLRGKSDKKLGGQKGHKGSSLKFSESPSEIIEHKPDYCRQCGENISSFEETFVEDVISTLSIREKT